MERIIPTVISVHPFLNFLFSDYTNGLFSQVGLNPMFHMYLFQSHKTLRKQNYS